MAEPPPAARPVGADAAGPDDSGAGARFVAEQLLATVREDIGRADAKAAILLSGALAGPVVLLSWRGSGPTPISLPGIVALLLGACCWLLGLIALVAALLPRMGTVRRELGLTYFKDLSEGHSLASLISWMEAAGRDPADWLLVRARDASMILAAKYRWIRRGAAALALGLIASITGALVR
jgi:hypothetical protein